VGQELSLAQEVEVLAILATAFVTYAWVCDRLTARRFRPAPRGPRGQPRPVTFSARPGIDKRVAVLSDKAA
jgi:hypothetical protein